MSKRKLKELFGHTPSYVVLWLQGSVWDSGGLYLLSMFFWRGTQLLRHPPLFAASSYIRLLTVFSFSSIEIFE
ncbi:unnamed protein product [Lactuca virosa]|uniref:Uncharacterized protein n=1 Tax=Lactuca virosa TaxID=75947 RepID=A0AAU9P2E7_9ASTR|nr:unnamed protein product [Lactuca virosa]